MNIQKHIRKVLTEEFPKYDYTKQITKNINAVDTLLKGLYPNFNKDGAHLKERRPLFWDAFLYECFDNETNHIYASYTPTKRELHMNPEVYNTLYDYLGEDVATYVIDWFNNEFDTDAEYVTY